MRQFRLSGSVEGVVGNHDSYSDPAGGGVSMGLRPARAGIKMESRRLSAAAESNPPPDQGEVRWGLSDSAIFITDYRGGAGCEDFFSSLLDTDGSMLPVIRVIKLACDHLCAQ